LPNGAATSYGYDAASQLTTLAHTGPFSATYGYTFDAVGRIVQQSGDGADWVYQYDVLGRLTRADHGADSFVYSHDAVGNILGDGRRYDVANRLTEDDNYTYSYDLRGNLTLKQHKTTGARTVYTWNTRNQLLSYAVYPDTQATEPAKVLSFSYDPVGRRASKVEDGVIERYVHDGLTLVGVLNSSGSVVNQFTFGPEIDEPLGMRSAVGNSFLQANHLGSIVALTGGSVIEKYNYDPYGKTIVTGSGLNHFRYTGREQDMEDLYYYRARYYDPAILRFLSEDRIGLKGGINTYTYVSGNPLSFVDSLGLAKSGRTEEIPGTNTTVRIDPPHVPGQQKHAHVCQKGCDDVVINVDGTGSHGTDPSKIKNKKVLSFLAKKGFRVALKCAAPVFFIYDWNEGGFGYAFNELTWPVSEAWSD